MSPPTRRLARASRHYGALENVPPRRDEETCANNETTTFTPTAFQSG